MILPIITRSVSNTGTDKTAKQNATTPMLGRRRATIDVLSKVRIQKIDMSIPIIKVPLSPINIFDVFPKRL